MKRVTIKSLTLTNFKGEKSRTTLFGEKSTTISGRNGLGKSRHFDAFVWLLFGKDHLDRKDYEVKTRIDGEELHQVECSVECTLCVDGEENTLKRSLIEDWVKPRGQAEQVFKGNHTECWWNEVPLRVGQFTEKVEGIIQPEVFKMLTNPHYFACMDWKLQRQQLTMLAGTVTDEQIASRNPDFKALLEKLGGKSFSEFRASVNAKKRRLRDELSQVQPRIDQTERMKPEAENYTKLQMHLNDVDIKIADIDRQIADKAEQLASQNKELDTLRSQARVMEAECRSILNKERQKADDEANAARVKTREIETAIKSYDRAIWGKMSEIKGLRSALSSLKAEVIVMSKEQQLMREQWQQENARDYNGETVCPHCGQNLPDEMIENARNVFASAKIAKLEEINTQGKALGERIKAKKLSVKTAEESILTREKEAQEVTAKRDSLKEILQGQETVKVRDIQEEDIPECVEIRKKIERMQEELTKIPTAVSNTELLQKKRELNTERAEIVSRMANRETIERCNAEILRLEQYGRELAQQIADLEKEEYTATEFAHCKVEECEKRINGLFSLVTFRLFEYTIEGNAYETCVPLIDGVPYGTANTAGQINAGLDIINALCRFYGVTVPIFVDNAESVNEYTPTESQMIYLRVTEEDKLTVTNY